MARHYYLTRSGRLRRKDNTLLFELSAEAEIEKAEGVTVEDEAGDADEINPVDLMGLEPGALSSSDEP